MPETPTRLLQDEGSGRIMEGVEVATLAHSMLWRDCSRIHKGVGSCIPGCRQGLWLACKSLLKPRCFAAHLALDRCAAISFVHGSCRNQKAGPSSSCATRPTAAASRSSTETFGCASTPNAPVPHCPEVARQLSVPEQGKVGHHTPRVCTFTWSACFATRNHQAMDDRVS